MLVGRESELAQVISRLERGEAVAVLGEAGVGKTALLREAAARSGRRVYEGGGLATLSWLPYLPVERALGRKLADGDAAWVASVVVDAVGTGVLLLDDLHWADDETRALLPLLGGRVAILTALRRGDRGSGRPLSELASLGVPSLELQPLDERTATRLVGALRPGLSAAATARLVERAGGNPLLLEELVATGEPSESLQLALAARLRQLDSTARESFELLSLAGRPLPRALLREGGEELAEAGLVVPDADRIAVRHALLAETAAATLDAATRETRHARLARLLDDPGEAARHHLAAGERALAFEHATIAAERAATAGERVSHLEVAALCAEGPDADAIRLEVADVLGEMRLDERALAVLEHADGSDPLVGARRKLFEARRSIDRGDVGSSEAAFAEGLALAAGSGSEVEARLAVEAAQNAQTRALFFDLDAAIAHASAAHAVELARGFPRTEALARRILGTSKLFNRTPDWDVEFTGALELARTLGSVELECRIAKSFAFGLRIAGRLDESQALCRTTIERAAESRLTAWEWVVRGELIGARWHAGELAPAFEEAERLRAEAADRASIDFELVQLLADLGRHDEACDLAERMVERAGPWWQDLGDALWALTDAQLAAGRPRQAIAAADRALASFGDRGPTAFLQVSRAWAQHDLGLQPDRTSHAAGQPISEGAGPELEAIALLAGGSHREAAGRFSDAARLWEGRHFRGMLRSTWAAGEALRRAGETDAAVEALTRAEAIAEGRGHATLLARVRRSLRLAGRRRASTRARDGVLTAREREVLELVGAGLSNVEIGRRLGIGRPSVARLVQSASRKLGARTRTQAAALAARK